MRRSFIEESITMLADITYFIVTILFFGISFLFAKAGERL